MLASSHAIFLLLFFLLLPASTLSQCDATFSFSGTAIAAAAKLTHCRRLPALGAELGWSLQNSTINNITTAIVDIVFAATPPVGSGWVAWGVNPGPKPRMVGTRALVAILQTGGGPPVVATYNVTADALLGCKLGNSSVEFRTENMRSNYSAATGRMVLAARLRLPPEYNASRLNHVWQVGPAAVGMVLMPHPKKLQNFDAAEMLNLVTGQRVGHIKTALRDAHGVLSVIGWGIFMPIGVITVRYFRSFPFQTRAWFLLHSSSQISAYVAGTTAWGIGLALLGSSKYYNTIMGHRIIGILVFCLATLQMMALWLKPKRRDKYRKYWSIYHHFVGYSLIALAIVNIFKGFRILEPPPKWRWVYVGIITSIGCAVLVLEIITWYTFIKQQTKAANASTRSKG